MALTDAQKSRLITVGQALELQNRTNTENTITSVKVNGTALTIDNKTVDILIDVVKKATANEGYAASYQITANGVAVSTDINIPKDFLVKGATLETATASNYQEVGVSAAGKKYIDFVINSVGNDATASHIYLPVEDLVDVYTAGNGLTVVNNEFSLVIDATNANGLSVGANGLALGIATDSVSGAMSATDHAQFTANTTKLAGISEEANKVTDTTEGDGAIEIDGTTYNVVNIATNADITQLLTDVYGA